MNAMTIVYWSIGLISNCFGILSRFLDSINHMTVSRQPETYDSHVCCLFFEKTQKAFAFHFIEKVEVCYTPLKRLTS
jgi:hypothetical protein